MPEPPLRPSFYLKPSYKGKVRDIYDLNDSLVISASDRVSAFDYVFPQEIAEKGKILTNISNHWFSLIKQVKNHLIETDHQKFPQPFCNEGSLSGRSVWVKKAKRIDYECIARGYLMGSAYKEYQKKQSIYGITLPSGMKPASKLPEAIFTPTTKSDDGHDEAISYQRMEYAIGESHASKLKQLSLEIYSWANAELEKNGIILLDTKFEFGLYEEELILIDEVLTPDSSRFCLIDDYEEALSRGKPPPSLDKQIIRDYLENIHWDQKPPLPDLPEDILSKTRETYLNIEKRVLNIN